ncbi:TetR/AcrR family transcriptional regulator [Nonomuraea sp. NPDC003707]
MDGKPYRGLSPEERHREQSERLLCAGFALMARGGYTAVTAVRVTAEAHTSIRVLYKTFGGSHQLSAAVITRCREDAKQAALKPRGTMGENTVAAVSCAVAGFVEYVTGTPGVFRVLYREAHHVAGRESWRNPLVAVLEELLSSGVEESGKSLRLLAAAIGGTVEALLREWFRTGEVSPQEIINTATHVYETTVDLYARAFPAEQPDACRRVPPS